MSAADGLEGTRPSDARVRGVVSAPTSSDLVRTSVLPAPPELSDVVERLWAGDWRFPAGTSHTTELLSDPCVNVVFEAGDGSAGSRVVGVWTRLWERTLAGHGRVRGVKLRPGALRAFFDVPAHALVNRIVPLRSHFAGSLATLERAVLDPADNDAGRRALTTWLGSVRRVEDNEDVSLAVAVVARIEADPAITTVDGLTAVAGLSRRPLQRLFREYVGVSPKWIIRRFRLREVAARLELGQAPNLAGLAVELGYADHAHLSRDFKHAVGQTPSAFRARMLTARRDEARRLSP